jgi:hypothetical protein
LEEIGLVNKTEQIERPACRARDEPSKVRATCEPVRDHGCQVTGLQWASQCILHWLGGYWGTYHSTSGHEFKGLQRFELVMSPAGIFTVPSSAERLGLALAIE